MLLYEHPLSSYAQKVKIALREKAVVFDRAARMAASEMYVSGAKGREYRDYRLL